MSDPNQSILILGAGVFGLSTALHLARKGGSGFAWYELQPTDVHFRIQRCDGVRSSTV